MSAGATRAARRRVARGEFLRAVVFADARDVVGAAHADGRGGRTQLVRVAVAAAADESGDAAQAALEQAEHDAVLLRRGHVERVVVDAHLAVRAHGEFAAVGEAQPRVAVGLGGDDVACAQVGALRQQPRRSLDTLHGDRAGNGGGGRRGLAPCRRRHGERGNGENDERRESARLAAGCSPTGRCVTQCRPPVSRAARHRRHPGAARGPFAIPIDVSLRWAKPPVKRNAREGL